MEKYKNDRLTGRAYNVEVERDERGLISGYALLFNSPTVIHDEGGDFEESISPGALDGCDMTDVLLCTNHDLSKIALARSKNGNGTLQLTADDKGLYFTAKLDIENNAEARAVYSSIKRGDVNGMSFLFRVEKDEWSDLDGGMPKRSIEKISIIHEISVVNFPAYSGAYVQARGEGETSTVLKEMRKSQDEETEKEREQKSAEELKLIKFKYFLREVNK